MAMPAFSMRDTAAHNVMFEPFSISQLTHTFPFQYTAHSGISFCLSHELSVEGKNNDDDEMPVSVTMKRAHALNVELRVIREAIDRFL